MMRIGRYPYLNSIPFFWREELWPGELIHCTPRLMGRLAAEGELDAGPLAIVDLFRLEDRFEPLPYGIVAPRAAQSVLLFSQRPLRELQGAVVAISEQTSTSVHLLKVLLEFRLGIRGVRILRRTEGGRLDGSAALRDPQGPVEAVLLIGDEALRRRLQPTAPFVYDLGKEWYAWTGLPFVFARWAVRRMLPAAGKRQIVRTLEESIEECFTSLPTVCSQHAPEWLSPRELENYLKGFSYKIGSREEEAISLFYAYLWRLDEAPAVPPPAATGLRTRLPPELV